MNPDEGNALVPAPKPEKPKKDIQQFSGDVAQAKRKPVKGFLKWTSEMFFSGRTWKEIMKDLYEHQIVPGMKNIVRDTLVGMIDAKFDDIPASPSTGTSSGGFITKMIDYSARSTGTSTVSTATPNKEPKKSGFELPCFTDIAKANEFLRSMKAEAQRFDNLSVYDIAWKQGKTIDWTWEAYGWTKEMINSIQSPKRLHPPLVIDKKKYEYYIDLPSPIQLTD